MFYAFVFDQQGLMGGSAIVGIEKHEGNASPKSCTMA